MLLREKKQIGNMSINSRWSLDRWLVNYVIPKFWHLGSEVHCSELYYHNPCHTDFKNRYFAALNKDNSSLDRLALQDFEALYAVQDYTDCSRSKSFPQRDLKEIELYTSSLCFAVEEQHKT